MPFMLREVDVPEGVRLVHCHLPVPQYPVIQDRKAAVVLVVDHAGQLWKGDHVVLERYASHRLQPGSFSCSR